MSNLRVAIKKKYTGEELRKARAMGLKRKVPRVEKSRKYEKQLRWVQQKWNPFVQAVRDMAAAYDKKQKEKRENLAKRDKLLAAIRMR